MYDKAAKANRQHWERMVKEGCGYTIPWLDLGMRIHDPVARFGYYPSPPIRSR
jgi:hypothetical protein